MPIAIRIEKNNDNYKLYWKECDGAGGYEPGNLIINDSSVISKNEWDTFSTLSKRFWTAPCGCPIPPSLLPNKKCRQGRTQKQPSLNPSEPK